MAAGATYTSIATTTLGSDASTVTFSSISGYTDLVCVYSVRTSATTPQDVYMQFNGDTSTNYSAVSFYGNGTSADSYRAINDSAILLDFYGSASPTSGPYNTGIVNVFNYSNGNTFKTVTSRTGRANNGIDTNTGMWRSVSAISSLTFKCGGGVQFATGSTFTIYGITAA